jgi:hypothetical protein
MKKSCVSLAIIIFLFGVSGIASALSITAADIAPVDGQWVNRYLGWAYLDPDGGSFKIKDIGGGYQGFGIGLPGEGGFVTGELDSYIGPYGPERINIFFAQPKVIDNIILGSLFAKGLNNDAVNEIARIETQSGTYTLTATSKNTASWTGNGTVANLSEAAGVWEITNPFGASAVTKLVFYAVRDLNGPLDSSNSDFSIISIDPPVDSPSTTVPEPTPLILLGLGLLTLIGLRKKIGQ